MPSSYTTDVDPAPATYQDVVDSYRNHHGDDDGGMLDRAHQLAERAHQGQVRKTGHPYITHPLAVAWHLAHYGLDAATVAAALLHDTIEDTEVTLEQVTSEFGPEVAALIDGVTKLDRIEYSSREEAQAATIRKMVVAMAQDVRVLLIKLVDRLHNMRTVSALREEKQRRVARETLDIYAPLAHRLGVQEIKHELEDRCFQILHPGPFAQLEAKLSERGVERSVFIEKMISEVEGLLSDSGIDAEVTGRPKHHFSIYRKMVEQDRPFDEIHDLIGIRVIVATTRDCYGALGLIHSHWVPLSGRFKDYVAMPKFNLYQSLHTTVVGPDGKPLEVQLRTEEMHRRAESGIAAHWRYKEGEGSSGHQWIDVGSLTEDGDDPNEFLANLKLDLYEDEVFVLTPAGDVKTLPRGATAVDFAYSVHTDVGHRCVGARINGRLLPLSTRLQSGDTVEVITAKRESGPSRDWLNFARSSRARSKIKQWFLKERREQALTEGREETLSALRREFPGQGGGERDELLAQTATDLGYRDVESLFLRVGDGTVSAGAVAGRARRLHSPEEIDGAPPFISRRRVEHEAPAVVVEGLDDMLVRLARCCEPIPGDPIEGFVTVGRGVSVHSSDCTNVGSLREHRERMVEVSWEADRRGSFAVWLQVEALDRTQLLRDVTAVISDTGGNITASSTVTGRDRVAILRYEVELSDEGQLPRMLADIRGVDGVYGIARIPNPS